MENLQIVWQEIPRKNSFLSKKNNTIHAKTQKKLAP